jgi:hypothetical protein
MPRELICSVANDQSESVHFVTEIAELQSLLKSRGENELECTAPVHYVCFAYFEIAQLRCIDASVFDLVQTWWAHRHPYSPCCIVRASSQTKLIVYCPLAPKEILRVPSTTAFLASRLLLLLVLTYWIYDGFYCKYKSWVVYSLLRMLPA